MAGEESGAQANPASDITGARILVVDDVEDNRHLLTRRLNREGYRDVVTAADGEEALALLADKVFDLVLLDVMMPKCDGYQVLERLRADGKLHELPVIMISALNEIDSIVRCIQLGAVDYLPKPFNPTLLRARVSATLEQKALRDAVKAHLARIEAELESARRLQMSMVPSVFPAPTPEQPLEIFAMMEPARAVGGDLYDFFPTEDGRLAFLIGDVSGKGVAAAMFMARTKNLLRVVTGLLRRAEGGAALPSDIVARVNGELCADNEMMMFVTLFFGIVDPKSGLVLFCNAGHDPAYRLGAGGIAPAVGPQGIALGVNPAWKYETGELRLAPGEALYLFTDGITEAMAPDDALFGKERLEERLRGLTDAPLARMIGETVRAVRDFAATCPQSDDITALALRLVSS
ncbi:MAG TPA: SpoIIE family protein phosphatase [Stellaceae bacterium]|nr:SpoIIE family protein phosphatase [Stellaceae bacterium]